MFTCVDVSSKKKKAEVGYMKNLLKHVGLCFAL